MHRHTTNSGNVVPGVVLNPGTYIVTGQDASETYYRVVLACQLLWVRKDTMQPKLASAERCAAADARRRLSAKRSPLAISMPA
ncbi:MAG: hypothetical protein U0521_18175 [Anaerolineae bacterium]